MEVRKLFGECSGESVQKIERNLHDFDEIKLFCKNSHNFQ